MKSMANIFFSNFKKKPFDFILLLILAISVALSALLPSYALKYLVDYLSKSQTFEKIWIYSLLFLGSYVLNCILIFFESWLLVKVSEDLTAFIRQRMIEKIMRLPPIYFSKNGAGYLTSRIIDDVDSIQTLFTDGIVSLGKDLIQIMATIVSIFVFSWIMGLTLLLGIPLAVLFLIYCQKRMQKSQGLNRKAINSESNYLSECLINARTVQNLGKQEYVRNKYGKLIKDSYKALKESYFFDSIFSPVIQFFKAIIIGIVVLVTVKDPSSMLISVGSLAASINLITDVFAPIESLGEEFSSMEEGIAALKRGDEFLKEKEDITRDESIKSSLVLKNKSGIEISNLSFSYPDGDEEVLENVNLSIKAGEKITFIGRTGAGKSTLFKLIMGLYAPGKGSIKIDGYEVSMIPNSQKRNMFGYVQQGFHPVNGTIEDQITLFDKTITFEEVQEVMKNVELDDYVKEKIPGGYQAKFSPNLFSKGQLQLLSTARALVKNPPIILLDEISANLDGETEKKVMNLFTKNFKDKTVVSISHRLIDLGFFEKIIKVENKNIEIVKY